MIQRHLYHSHSSFDLSRDASIAQKHFHLHIYVCALSKLMIAESEKGKVLLQNERSGDMLKQAIANVCWSLPPSR